jgi:hypothetical protein
MRTQFPRLRTANVIVLVSARLVTLEDLRLTFQHGAFNDWSLDAEPVFVQCLLGHDRKLLAAMDRTPKEAQDRRMQKWSQVCGAARNDPDILPERFTGRPTEKGRFFDHLAKNCIFQSKSLDKGEFSRVNVQAVCISRVSFADFSPSRAVRFLSFFSVLSLSLSPLSLSVR